MKKIIVEVIASSLLFACKQEKQKSLTTLKAERAALDEQIKAIEAKETSSKVRKSTDVSVMSITPTAFVANIDIQAQVTGEQNVLASPQAPGTVTKIFVKPGQHVSSGQVLATLDASALEQQIQAVEATLSFARSAYDRLQKLYAQNIGSDYIPFARLHMCRVSTIRVRIMLACHRMYNHTNVPKYCHILGTFSILLNRMVFYCNNLGNYSHYNLAKDRVFLNLTNTIFVELSNNIYISSYTLSRYKKMLVCVFLEYFESFESPAVKLWYIFRMKHLFVKFLE